jgi:chromodomain-helicase-DNA-binding protein 7
LSASTLAHWLREFEEWTEMNTILYHGSNESRELIREVEWHFAPNVVPPPKPGSEAPLLYKFHVLITSYEVIKQDLHVFKKIPWRYVVIDEAHRLKNKDSALAADLRTISMEHMHLLSGTPLQNNTTELWALLYFLDRQLFPSLDEFLAEFGTLTDSAQGDALSSAASSGACIGRTWRRRAGAGSADGTRGSPHHPCPLPSSCFQMV